MNIQSEKLEIMKLILETNNPRILESIKKLFNKSTKVDFWETLTQEQKDDMLNHSHHSLNAFEVKIYPNPSPTGKIKMEWADGQNVDQITILSQDNKLNFVVKNQSELTVDGLENGKYFIRFYSKKKLLGIKQIKVMKF